MIKYDQYYLDLNLMEKLDSQKYEAIHQLYMELLNRSAHDSSSTSSIFHTLEKSGYLRSVRDKKLEDILN